MNQVNNKGESAPSDSLWLLGVEEPPVLHGQGAHSHRRTWAGSLGQAVPAGSMPCTSHPSLAPVNGMGTPAIWQGGDSGERFLPQQAQTEGKGLFFHLLHLLLGKRWPNSLHFGVMDLWGQVAQPG